MVSVFIYSSGFGLQTPYSFHFAEFIDTIYPQRVFTTFELINCYGTRSRWLFFSLDCFIDAIFLHLMTKCFALTLILFLSPSRFQLLLETGNHPLCAPTSMFNVPFCDKPIYSFIHEIVIVSIDHALERFESTWKYYLYCGRHCRETPISMNQREKKKQTANISIRNLSLVLHLSNRRYKSKTCLKYIDSMHYL